MAGFKKAAFFVKHGLPVRLLLTTPNLDTAGMKYVIADLVSGLNRKDFQIRLCVHKKTGVSLERELEQLTGEIIEMPLRIPTRPLQACVSGLSRLARFFRGRYDLIHSFDYASNWPEGLAARWAGIPLIMEKTNMTWGTRRWCFSSLMASRIICLSSAQRKDLFEKTPFKNKTSVVPTGIDLDRFSPLDVKQKNELRQKLGWPQDEVCIVSVAKLVAVKGHCELMRAFAALLKKKAGIKTKLFFIGGDNPSYEQELRQLASQPPLQDKVVFLGRRDDLPKILPAFDGFVLATRNEGPRESFGAVLVEAMACGLPCIATYSGGPEDIVEPGKTGWLVDAQGFEPLVPALEEMVCDEKRRTKFGQAGRARVENFFSKQSMTEHYRNIYFKTVGIK